MGPALPTRITFGPNADTQEWRKAKVHHPVEKLSLLGIFEVSEMHSSGEAFASVSLSHFRFRKSNAQVLPPCSSLDLAHRTIAEGLLFDT